MEKNLKETFQYYMILSYDSILNFKTHNFDSIDNFAFEFPEFLVTYS